MNNGIWIKADMRLLFVTDLAMKIESVRQRYSPYTIIANDDIVQIQYWLGFIKQYLMVLLKF